MKIYLAGKIKSDGWRDVIVDDDGWSSPAFTHPSDSSFGERRFDFGHGRFSEHRCTGPFFLPEDHGSYHGENSHGIGANDTHWCSPRNDWVVSLCLDGIRRADVVFVWLGPDAFDAFGTIFETGYAKALGIPVWLAGDDPIKDQWFIHAAADRCLWGVEDAADALTWYLDHSSHLPQSADIYMKQAASDPEVVKARKIFTEFGPAGVRIPIPRHIRSAVWAKTGGTCWYCKRTTNPYDDFQVDHIMPVSKGGANRIDNLVPCCKSCNASKGAAIVAEQFR